MQTMKEACKFIFEVACLLHALHACCMPEWQKLRKDECCMMNYANGNNRFHATKFFAQWKSMKVWTLKTRLHTIGDWLCYIFEKNFQSIWQMHSMRSMFAKVLWFAILTVTSNFSYSTSGKRILLHKMIRFMLNSFFWN